MTPWCGFSWVMSPENIMDPLLNSKEIARLYREFSDSFVGNDDEAIRGIYRELLRLGRPRAEIVKEAVRLAASTQGGFPEPASTEPIGRSHSKERFVGIDRFSKLRVAQQPACDVVSHRSGTGVSVPEPRIEIGKDPIAAGGNPASEDITLEGNDPVFDGGSPMSLFKSARRIGLLLRSPIAHFSALVGVVVFASVAALAFLPARGTAEKSARPEPAVAAMQSFSQSSAVAAPVPSVTPAVGKAQRHEPTASTSEGAVLLTDSNAGDHSKSELATAGSQPEKADPNSTGSSPVTSNPALAGNNERFTPVARGETEIARASETVHSRYELPEDRPSPGVVAPPAINVMPSELGQKPLLSKSNLAVLLTRADSLLSTGDIVSARLFYERAADGGSGEAALRLGETYDPQFLAQAHLRGLRGDVATAILWYKRARELGVREAEILLGALLSN